jgi:hypothetical protein
MKPCPFCGSDALTSMLTVEVCTTSRHGTWKSYCECQNCGAVGPTHFDQDSEESAREGAIYSWNERVNICAWRERE